MFLKVIYKSRYYSIDGFNFFPEGDRGALNGKTPFYSIESVTEMDKKKLSSENKTFKCQNKHHPHPYFGKIYLNQYGNRSRTDYKLKRTGLNRTQK